MIISDVTIKNFKGIEEIKIDFKPGFNLIKGINGKGKTSILEAIAVGLGGFVAGLEGVATRHFSTDEIRTVYSKIGDGSYGKKHSGPEAGPVLKHPEAPSSPAISAGRQKTWQKTVNPRCQSLLI